MGTARPVPAAGQRRRLPLLHRIYASAGVLFLPTKGVVAGIGVFRSGAPPSTFLRLY